MQVRTVLLWISYALAPLAIHPTPESRSTPRNTLFPYTTLFRSIEQAGGASTNGKQRIMDLQPSKLHERVSVILGAKNEVELLTAYHHTARATDKAGL